jgi:hypothetical protein
MDILYENVIDFLKTKEIEIPFGKSDAFMIAKDPIKVVEDKVKDKELKLFLTNSLNQLNKVSDPKLLPDVIKTIKRYSQALKDEYNKKIADIFVAIVEKSYELYTSKDWNVISGQLLAKSTQQKRIEPFLKITTMIAADAAGAAIGAIIGANPGTTVGAAVTVSTLAKELLIK